MRRLGTAVRFTGVAAAVLLAASACSSGGSSASGGGGLPNTIKVTAVLPLTGTYAFAGTSTRDGYTYAAEQVNASGILGSSKLQIDFKDTSSNPQTAATLVSSAASDKSVAAIFGSPVSAEALAISPIAQRQKLPVVYTQSGSDGVVIGDFIYRAAPPLPTYYGVLEKYIREKGYKSVGVIYATNNPTLTEVATKTLPGLAGLQVTKSVGVTATTQDLSAPISQVLGSKPDVVASLLAGPQNPTVMTQLRRAGYTGPVLSNLGACCGNLDPAGNDATGMVWPEDFSSSQTAPSSKKFTDGYTRKYGKAPTYLQAEAYDATFFLARSIAEAKTTNRTSIKDAMKIEAGKTFDGALGSGLTWKDQNLVAPGAVVQWDGKTKSEVFLYEGGS
jgi:branched-chain amino acid transport system substrate-binding protein